MASPPRSTATPSIFRSTPTPRSSKQPAPAAQTRTSRRKRSETVSTQWPRSHRAPLLPRCRCTIPGPARDIPVRLYHPPRTSGRSAAIVWFHQGGGVIGGLDTDHTLCTMLSDACQAVVISVDYRLAPEHPFPADVVDSLAAYQCESLFACGIDPFRTLGEIDAATRRALYETAAAQLQANLGRWRRETLRGGLAVYGRERQGCRECGVGIRTTKQGGQGRITWWCPRCQS
ncbi:MAG: alpha/beta hydrolase fold domain-containing protein [Acidimicrobiales bacterium]|nr:alpha/beta hydrolase fold domain-containing protein [Acidimicrobiales bacterium]